MGEGGASFTPAGLVRWSGSQRGDRAALERRPSDLLRGAASVAGVRLGLVVPLRRSLADSHLYLCMPAALPSGCP